MAIVKFLDVASKRSTLLFPYICSHVLWIFSDNLEVGMFAIFGNVISCIQKQRTIPLDIVTTTTYNENDKTYVKRGIQKKKVVYILDDDHAKLKMTIQSTIGDPKCTNKNITYKVNEGCPLMDTVVPKHKPLQYVGLSLRTTNPWYSYPLLEFMTIHITLIQSLGFLVCISKWIQFLIEAILNMSLMFL